jgi:signal transduction histidine kinase
MQKFLYYFKRVCLVLQFILPTIVIFQLIVDYSRNPAELTAYLAMDMLLLLWNVYRIRAHPLMKYYSAAIGFSIVDCSVLLSLSRYSAIQIYYFFLLDQLFDIKNKNTKHIFIALHLTAFLSAEVFYLFAIEHPTMINAAKGIVANLFAYALVMLVFLIVHYYKSEQDRLQILNSDLIAYSFEEREYLLSKERNDISQELHDSVGHSLMAALMNIRYLKVVMPQGNEKLDEQIIEIENLLKNCVSSLRGSVSDLRRLDENIDLKAEIEHIARKFNELGFVKIELKFDNKADYASGQIKSVIYKTIREGITNSIRHGNASKIWISVLPLDTRIELIVRDNGIGCVDIHKSFGLNGILERVKAVNGEVYFSSEKNRGFTIRALLPGNGDDQE